MKVLSKVSHGELSICNECKLYHLEFNNVYFEFTTAQFKRFKNFILTLDEAYWETKYANAKVSRKIPIPSKQTNLVLMFNRYEIRELKQLFKFASTNCSWYLSVDDIDYKLVLN
ncbi:DUF6686 family protein [Psychroserpens ponticola]|uniref:Uncharacterized protein n=1 Tax=Psychroserpens ponticola TaxID=2932268 RepID=A0ABY7S442_9FLAO|nr:DUF6686 family protein [Psychroserpens ponticola]WCO02670.1 hypothetical protein MUN68_004040 [Psychroserpens ponticola]